MLYGAGNIALVSRELATNGNTRPEELLFPGCIAEFELNADVNFAEAKCLTGGKLQIAASEITEETYTLTLNYEFMDWTTMQIAYNELAQSQASVSLPVVKTAIVPAGGVIADADITVTTAPSVLSYISEKGTYAEKHRIFNEIITTGTPASAVEVLVDGAGGDLTYHSTVVGKTVTYVVNKTFTSVESIGAGGANSIGTLQFSGLVYGTEFANDKPVLMLIRAMKPIGKPALTVNGDLAVMTVEYRPQALPGKRSVYEFYSLETAA